MIPQTPNFIPLKKIGKQNVRVRLHANERTLRLKKRRSSSGAGRFREEGVDARLATDRTDRCEAPFPAFPAPQVVIPFAWLLAITP